MKWLRLILCVGLLGCGQRGALYLPVDVGAHEAIVHQDA